MKEQRRVYKALAQARKEELSSEKVELKSEKVDLSKVNDIKDLLDKAERGLKESADKAKGLKRELSQNLIIVSQNIPAQANNALKLAEELGASGLISELKALISLSKRLESEFTPLYRAL